MIIKVHSPHDYAPLEIQEASTIAMGKTLEYLKGKMKILTPKLTGGLRQSITIDYDANYGSVGFEDSNIVGKVFEKGGQWRRMPPHIPIAMWVEKN